MPLEAISYLALSVTALAAAAIAVYVILYLVLGNAPSGFMTLLTTVLFLGGIQLLCLAVIGDYLARVFEEVKQRPHFLVKSVFNAPPPRTTNSESRTAETPPAGRSSQS